MKKVVAMLLVLTMTLSMAACGSKAEAPTETPAAEPEIEAPAEEPAAPTEAPEEGKTYTIGVLMKTLASPYWQSMAEGLEKRVAELDNVTIEIFGAESEED